MLLIRCTSDQDVVQVGTHSRQALQLRFHLLLEDSRSGGNPEGQLLVTEKASVCVHSDILLRRFLPMHLIICMRQIKLGEGLPSRQGCEKVFDAW